jgi:hypothetical protein
LLRLASIRVRFVQVLNGIQAPKQYLLDLSHPEISMQRLLEALSPQHLPSRPSWTLPLPSRGRRNRLPLGLSRRPNRGSCHPIPTVNTFYGVQESR